MRRSLFNLTLDDLFGSDLDAEIESLRALVERAWSEENRFAPPGEAEAVEDLQDRMFELCKQARIQGWKRLHGAIEKLKAPPARFWHVMFLGEPVAAWRMGPEGSVEVKADKGGWPSIQVSLFPSLGAWLTDVRWTIESSIREGQEAAKFALEQLRATIERFAEFDRQAAKLTLVAIRLGLAKARRKGATEPRILSTGPTLRDLVAELLSPSVLAAGGGPGSFVLRI